MENTNSGQFDAPWAQAGAEGATPPAETAPETPENTEDTAQSSEAPTVTQESQENAPPAAEEPQAPADGYVTVVVPKAYKFFVNPHVEAKYAAGVQEMLVSHANHWYSKACGVQIYVPKKPD